MNTSNETQRKKYNYYKKRKFFICILKLEPKYWLHLNVLRIVTEKY